MLFQALIYGLQLKLKISYSPLHTSGKDDYGFGYGGTGKKSVASQFDNYGEVSM